MAKIVLVDVMIVCQQHYLIFVCAPFYILITHSPICFSFCVCIVCWNSTGDGHRCVRNFVCVIFTFMFYWICVTTTPYIHINLYIYAYTYIVCI